MRERKCMQEHENIGLPFIKIELCAFYNEVVPLLQMTK